MSVNTCYNTAVQTPFYASGFLYNLKTHRILLIQSKHKDNIVSEWSAVGGESKKGEDAQSAFQRIVYESLDVNLKMKHIHPVYDYFHDTLDKVNYVFYAEVKSASLLNHVRGNGFSWVAFNETLKLPFPAHTKQDVIVCERVINAKWREDEENREKAIS